MSYISKFGRSTNVDSGVDTDIWDRANATDDQDVWVAPTQARTHAIVSTSTDDDDGGSGANTVMVYGLTDWDTPEVSETVTMDGTTPVNTSNAYVIIHRMVCVTWGASGPNVGVITATASTDATVTAQINAGDGQTQMAVYGVPSVKTLCVTGYYASVLKPAVATDVLLTLLVNQVPDSQLSGFIVKHTNAISSVGGSYMKHVFQPFFAIAGPAIVKLKANASANNADVSGGFDGTLVWS